MLLVGAFLAIGLLIGVGFGGSPRNLAGISVRLWWLAPVGLALQTLPVSRAEQGVGELRPALVLMFSFVVLVVVAAANWRQPGFIAILVGVALNAVVIGANGGMPVSGEALADLGQPEDVAELAAAERGEKHHLLTDEDTLTPLADVIPVGEPFEVIVSVGDLLAYGGAGGFLAAATLRPRRDPATRPPPPRATPS